MCSSRTNGLRARGRCFRNEHCVPREEKPSALAGGKVVNFDRVEWLTMPDPPTVVGALQKGEVDWWEAPLFDLLPKLHMSAGVTVEMIQRLGWLGMLYFNDRVPPFDNPKLRRALLPAVNQSDYMQAVVGDQADLKRTGVGLFAPGSPFETGAGMEILNGPRDPKLASRLVKENGYRGEPVVQMAPADLPHLNALSQVTRQMMESVGLNVVFQSMDWALSWPAPTARS
jgi:peptide/nickel transport system substrate-binding protein